MRRARVVAANYQSSFCHLRFQADRWNWLQLNAPPGCCAQALHAAAGTGRSWESENELLQRLRYQNIVSIHCTVTFTSTRPINPCKTVTHDFSSSCIRCNRSTDTSCNQVEYVPKVHYQTLSFTAVQQFSYNLTFPRRSALQYQAT